MTDTPDIYPLKHRRQYLAVAATGLKKPMPGLVLQIKPPEAGSNTAIGVGLTATKRTGGAVERNRIKRRLRRVIAAVLPDYGKPGCQYVVIGRKAARLRPYKLLTGDLKTALEVLHKRLASNG